MRIFTGGGVVLNNECFLCPGTVRGTGQRIMSHLMKRINLHPTYSQELPGTMQCRFVFDLHEKNETDQKIKNFFFFWAVLDLKTDGPMDSRLS